jgi:hypothetical protein
VASGAVAEASAAGTPSTAGLSPIEHRSAAPAVTIAGISPPAEHRRCTGRTPLRGKSIKTTTRSPYGFGAEGSRPDPRPRNWRVGR